MRLATLLAMTLLFTAGCATERMHPTKSNQQWQADSEECKAQGDQAARKIPDTYARTLTGLLARDRRISRVSRSVTDSCLREKGWTR